MAYDIKCIAKCLSRSLDYYIERLLSQRMSAISTEN